MILGELVNLRAVEREDAAIVYRWLNDPVVMRGWGWSASAASMHAVTNLIAFWLDQEPLLGRPPALIADSLQGDPVGLVVLTSERPEARAVELSMLVGDPMVWGQGFGSDILHAILDACFTGWGAHRVGVQVEDDNPRALMLYQRFGFQEEGRLRQGAFRDGQYRDILLLSLLAAEWTGAAPNVVSDGAHLTRIAIADQQGT
ncbi:MAG: GNAT family protein [Thermomicrobiales bacterium]